MAGIIEFMKVLFWNEYKKTPNNPTTNPTKLKVYAVHWNVVAKLLSAGQSLIILLEYLLIPYGLRLWFIQHKTSLMLSIEIVDQVVKTNVFHIISTAYVNYDNVPRGFCGCNLGVANQPFYCPDRGCSGLCRWSFSPAIPTQHGPHKGKLPCLYSVFLSVLMKVFWACGIHW